MGFGLVGPRRWIMDEIRSGGPTPEADDLHVFRLLNLRLRFLFATSLVCTRNMVFLAHVFLMVTHNPAVCQDCLSCTGVGIPTWSAAVKDSALSAQSLDLKIH